MIPVGGDFTTTALRVAIYLSDQLPLGSIDEGLARIGLERQDIGTVNAVAENEPLIEWCKGHGIDCHLFNLPKSEDEDEACRRRGQSIVLFSDTVIVMLSAGMYNHDAALIIGAAMGVPQTPLYVSRI